MVSKTLTNNKDLKLFVLDTARVTKMYSSFPPVHADSDSSGSPDLQALHAPGHDDAPSGQFARLLIEQFSL